MNNSTNLKLKPVVFHHFSRKSYALFSVLKREVTVGVLSVATVTTASAAITLSDVRPVPAGRIDTVVLNSAEVTASRAPLAAQVAARQVTTLSRADIAAAGVTSVNDVLKLAAGVDVRQRGGFGIQTDISIDGGTFDQITLLVNGVPINNPQTGHNAADFPVNVSDIDHIEILQGAASRIFGSQAFSGAINIVTKPLGDALFLKAEGGSYGTFREELRSSHRWQRFNMTLSRSMQRSDGAVENGDYKTNKVFWTGRLSLPRFVLKSQASALWNDFGANTFYSAAFPNQWEATRRFMVALQGEWSGRIHLSPQLSWARNVDHFQLIRGTKKAENFHRGNVLNSGLNAWTDWAAGRTLLGVELRYEDIQSSNLGLPVDSSKFVRVHGQRNSFYTHRDHRTNTSLFLEHTLVLNHWTFSAGVMGQTNTSVRGGLRFYPGVDVAYRPMQSLKLFASFNRSMRLPTFTDLYYKSPTQEGNKDLKAEENSSFRVGADYVLKGFKAQASAFYNRGNNMIDWVMRSPTDKFHATSFNLDNVGVSLQMDADLRVLLGQHQPLERFAVSYAYIHQNRRDGEAYFKSNYALEYLRHKLVLRLSHRIYKQLDADWSLRVQRREGNYLVYENHKSTGQLHPYGTHALLDLKLKWAAKSWTAYVDMSNLTATRYYDLGNVRQPGFVVMAGADIRLNDFNFMKKVFGRP